MSISHDPHQRKRARSAAHAGNPKQQKRTPSRATAQAGRRNIPQSAAPVSAARLETATAAPAAGTKTLTSAERRHLRGFAHALKPIVLVGQKGVTAALLCEMDAALAHHELLKVKLGGGDRSARDASIDELCVGCGAVLVQAIGRVASLYRRNPDRAQFNVPG